MTALVLRREAFEHGLLPVHQLLPAVETLALVQVRDVSPLSLPPLTRTDSVHPAAPGRREPARDANPAL